MYHSLLRNTLASRNLFIRRETIVTQLLFLTTNLGMKIDGPIVYDVCYNIIPTNNVNQNGYIDYGTKYTISITDLSTTALNLIRQDQPNMANSIIYAKFIAGIWSYNFCISINNNNPTTEIINLSLFADYNNIMNEDDIRFQQDFIIPASTANLLINFNAFLRLENNEIASKRSIKLEAKTKINNTNVTCYIVKINRIRLA
jgi:hypothetical protein